jgi:hypothetical protein
MTAETGNSLVVPVSLSLRLQVRAALRLARAIRRQDAPIQAMKLAQETPECCGDPTLLRFRQPPKRSTVISLPGISSYPPKVLSSATKM